MRYFVSAAFLAAIVAFPSASDAGEKKGEKKKGTAKPPAKTVVPKITNGGTPLSLANLLRKVLKRPNNTGW